MPPDKARVLLDNVARSLGMWIDELAEVERCCPGKVSHLLASMRQGHTSLTQMIERDKVPRV